MNYTTKTKIVNFFAKFIPTNTLKKKFRVKFGITRYNNNRNKYNIGKYSYLSINALCAIDYTKIGKYCSIARDTLIAPGQHPIDRISTHPFTYTAEEKNLYGNLKTPNEKIIPNPQKNTEIGNDVWIGAKAIVQSGVTIGDGAVIGAGAVVTKDIPPYAIAVGVPAKVIKYRFSPEIIEKLLELKWWDYPEDFIVNELPFDNIEKCIEILEENKHLRIEPCEK